MTRLKDVTRYVRSKNAGPFWVTVDIFFNNPEAFEAHRNAAVLSPESIGAIYGVPSALVKRYEVLNLAMVKISYPRQTPQGGMLERDMHSGQSYVRLLDLNLRANGAAAVETT